MARLDPTRMKKKVEQSLAKDKVLKRKLEKQKQKEIYEEKWYKDEMEKRAKELEEVAPQKEKDSEDNQKIKNKSLLPSFFDSLDINTLFDPIETIKNKDGKNLKVKIENYKSNEKLFEPGLIYVDDDYRHQDELASFYDRIFNNDENYQNLIEKRVQVSEKLKQERKQRLMEEKAKKKFNLDLSELNKEEKAELEKLIEEYENIGISKEDLEVIEDNEVPSITNKDIIQKLGEFRTNFFSKVSGFFQRYIPIYNKYMCTCCGKPKDLEEYYIYYNLVNISRTDYYGNVRLSICKSCSEKLFNYLYLEDSGKSIEVALKKWCAYLNIYYDDKIVIQALRNFSVHEHEFHFIKEYLDLLYLNEENIEKTFLDSRFLYKAFDKIEQGEDSPDEIIAKTEPIIWTKEDIRNKKQVIRIIGYDPFSYQTDENKKILYSDLLNMLEAGMENDMTKVQAAIQIVLSYFRIRELNVEEYEKRKNNASLDDLKKLSELKSKELNSISKFSQDNGFSERYATAKAKGENTFTGILKKMNEDLFEDAILNKYDIETSTTINQAAQASISNIFKQLNMSSAEYGVLCSNQLADITKLREENSLLTEQIRKLKVELKKADLIDQAREAGIEVDDDYEDENEDIDEDD